MVSPDNGVVSKVLEVANSFDLEGVSEISRQRFEEAYPSMALPEDCRAVVEQDAGYLLVERCIKAHLRLAKRNGAECWEGVQVTGFEAKGGVVTVRTSCGKSLTTVRLIVAAGAWTSQLLSGYHVDRLLSVRRKHLHWLAVSDEATSVESGFPVFIYESPDGLFYGFPKVDELGLKVSEHSRGEAVENPSMLSREVDMADWSRVEQFVSKTLKGVTSQRLRHDVCMYTMTPDEHFIIDTLPENANIAFAAGLSGHGFKQSNALGEALVELVLSGDSHLPIEFLRLRRFDSVRNG